MGDGELPRRQGVSVKEPRPQLDTFRPNQMPDKDEPIVAIDLIFDLGSIAIIGRLTETRAIQLVLIALHCIALHCTALHCIVTFTRVGGHCTCQRLTSCCDSVK